MTVYLGAFRNGRCIRTARRSRWTGSIPVTVTGRARIELRPGFRVDFFGLPVAVPRPEWDFKRGFAT